MSQQQRVLIVGAGPVGLMTAIQLRLHNKNVIIDIFEKHDTYSRSHVLQLQRSSFWGIPKNKSSTIAQSIQSMLPPTIKAVAGSLHQNFFSSITSMVSKPVHQIKSHVFGTPEEKEAVNNDNNSLEQKINKWLSHNFIRTNIIETDLQQLAQTMNISIHRNVHVNKKNWKQIVDELYSTSSIVVGADGAHSIVREIIFKNEFSFNEPLNYLVEFKYEVIGVTRALKLVEEKYKTLKMSEHLVLEQVGKYDSKTNSTPITLHIMVEEEIFEMMQSATFKNAFSLGTHRASMPESLVTTIEQWLKVRKLILNDQYVEGKDRITSTQLRTYASKNFVRFQSDSKRMFVLVGDAAIGCVYFRGLNVGFRCSTELAKVMDVHLKNSESNTNLWNEYESFLKAKSKIELQAAQIKNQLLQSSFTSTQLMSKIDENRPHIFNIFSWSTSTKNKIQNVAI